MFYSETNKPATIPHPTTNIMEPEYTEIIDPKTGKRKLKETGKVNVYQKIQDSMEGILLANNIEKQRMKTNEFDITKLESAVTDLTNMPDNLIEQLNVISAAKQTFNQADTKIKEAFNNNFNEFLAGSFNGSILSILKEKGVKTLKKQEIAPEEPKNTLESELEATKIKLEELQKQQGVTNNG